MNGLKPNGVSEGQWMAFCRDAKAGVSPASLSLVYGRPVATVYRWLNRLGIKKEAPAAIARGAAAGEIETPVDREKSTPDQQEDKQ